MNELITRFSGNHLNKELEVRTRILSWQEWKTAFLRSREAWGGSFVVTQSITAIKFEEALGEKPREGPRWKRTQERKEIHFQKGVKTEEKYFRKKTLAFFQISEGRKLTLSEEVPIPGFRLHNAQLLRVRLRGSFLPPEFSLRVDFTFVWTLLPSQFGEVTAISNKMFPKGKTLGEEDFLEFVEALGSPPGEKTPWELEIEYVGDAKGLQPATFKHELDQVLEVLSPDDQQSQRVKSLARFFSYWKKRSHPRTLKQFLNQPITLTPTKYLQEVIPRVTEFFLSDKADGERALVLAREETLELLRSDSVLNLTERVKTLPETKGVTLMDAEAIFNEKGELEKVYVFDLLLLEGRDLTGESFLEREALFSEAVKPYAPLLEKKIQERLTESLKEIPKIYERATRLYPIDGLIFTSSGEKGYWEMKVFKWKPPEKLSIDFLIVKAPKQALGVAPYLPKPGKELFFLLSGISYHGFKNLHLEYFPGYVETFESLGVNLRENYFPIQFSPSSQPLAYLWYVNPNDLEKGAAPEGLHGHVGEFTYSLEKEEGWKLIKMRPDRDVNVREQTGYGNDFRVAEETFQQFFRPFTLDMLTRIDALGFSEGYFQEVKSKFYTPAVKFNSFVKAQVLRQLEGMDLVVDLAVGKGQDLFAYSGFGVKHLVGVDKDPQALIELNNRRYDLGRKELYLYHRPPKTPPAIYTKEMDLLQPAEKLLKELRTLPLPALEEGKVDAVVINLAIHYLLSGKKELEILFHLVDSLLRPGGVFIYTCFSGERVFEELQETDTGKSWDLLEGEVVKYSIRKLYESSRLESFGQKIAVIHPFSKGEYYEENLVNLEVVNNYFLERGFELRQNGSFLDWLDKFRAFNKSLAASLTPQDLSYVSLYQYVSLWKEGSKEGGAPSPRKEEILERFRELSPELREHCLHCCEQFVRFFDLTKGLLKGALKSKPGEEVSRGVQAFYNLGRLCKLFPESLEFLFSGSGFQVEIGLDVLAGELKARARELILFGFSLGFVQEEHSLDYRLLWSPISDLLKEKKFQEVSEHTRKNLREYFQTKALSFELVQKKNSFLKEVDLPGLKKKCLYLISVKE